MSRVIHELKSIFFSEKIILDYKELPALINKVNLNYYHAEFQSSNSNNKPDICNLGDFLSEIVVDYLLKEKNLSLNSKVSGTKHLYAIGSILLMGYQNAVVWGTGFPYEPSYIRALFHNSYFRKLDVRCVRGPYTKKTMERLGHKCPNYFGDPAVLMPYIYTPNVEKKQDYIFIPHYSMEEKYNKIIPPENILSMNTKDYKYVIDKIASSKKVISSSLHGIILAESYGVPAVFYRDRAEKFDYKYSDWYLSTNRENYKIIDNIKEAIDCDYEYVPDLSDMRQILMDTFPYDLWAK